MSLRALYTGPDGLVIVADRPLKNGQVVGDDGGDITVSADTVAELLLRRDFQPAEAIAVVEENEREAAPAPRQRKRKD